MMESVTLLAHRGGPQSTLSGLLLEEIDCVLCVFSAPMSVSII